MLVVRGAAAATARLLGELNLAAAGQAVDPLRDQCRLVALEQAADAARLGRLARGRGRVFGLVPDQHPLVVAQDRRTVGHAHEVVGHERNLAAAVRAIDDVGRDGDAGHVPAQALHDLHALPDARAEVARAGHRVAVEQVVRPHLDAEQPAQQRADGAEAVVHALQEDGVVVDDHAVPDQRLADAVRLGGHFARVVEVRLDVDLLGVREGVEQFLVVKALRQRDRHAGADADHIDVVDLLQVLQVELELVQRQRERVAAGDDDVADGRGVADVLDHALVVGADALPPAAGQGGALAGAIAAVHRAVGRGDE